MKYVEMGKLIMVGAGPGDVDLITLKGIKALKKADVVLYDALANAELLQYCKEDCLKIYVGKKAGIHSYQQIYINDMIVDYARQHDTVVRLKGGDPYVFGRGHEEYEHAASNGIEVEVIPGVSSALAAPANCQIPLTKRGVNESFWVITGHTRDGGFSRDMISAAKSSATVVILMGLGNLSKIVSAFSVCRGSKEPIAIIQNGTRPNEKRVVSTLQNIEEEVKGKSISSPAIIVIGEVVNESLRLQELVAQGSENYISA